MVNWRVKEEVMAGTLLEDGDRDVDGREKGR